MNKSDLATFNRHHDTGFISVAPEESRDLRAYLIYKGYGVITLNNQPSFFVVDLKNKGTLQSDLIKLGKLYGQDKVTFAKAASDYYQISLSTQTNSSQTISLSELLGDEPKFSAIASSTYVNGSRLSIPELRSCHHYAQDVIKKFSES